MFKACVHGQPAPAPHSSRALRVACMLVAIVAMSAGDLYMTMLHLKSFGMVEANPIARIVMEYNCGWLLGAWKFATVAVGFLILWTFRQRRSAEIGAIVCTAILTALTIQWIRYSDQAGHELPTLHALAQEDEPTSAFVRMEP